MVETGTRTEGLLHSSVYRHLAAAQALRGVGFWLTWLGMLALASFTLHATPGQLLLNGALTSLPFILFSTHVGTLVDRWNPKWALMAAFALNAASALALVFITHVWQLYIVSFGLASSGTLVWPALGSILKQISGPDKLIRANGILNSIWEATLIAGPALAGGLSVLFGRRAPMMVAVALYLCGFVGVATMRFTPAKSENTQRGTQWFELRQGLVLIFRLKDLRALALWGAVAWGGFAVLLAVEPLFVRDVMHGGDTMLNWFYSVGGIGSTLGALGVGMFAFARKELRLAAIALAMVGGAFALYVWIARWPHVLPIHFFIGMGFAVYQTLTQTLVQRRALQGLVGRALAAKRGLEETAGFAGALLAGAFATALGSRSAMMIAGGLMMLSALALLIRSIRLAKEEPAIDLDEGSSQPMPDGLLPSIEVAGIDPLHDIAAPAVLFQRRTD